MTALILAVWALAVARVTRIITTDKIMEWFRDWLVHRYTADSLIAYFFYCRACASIWIAFATAPYAIAVAGVSWAWWPALALTASMITVLLAELESAE